MTISPIAHPIAHPLSVRAVIGLGANLDHPAQQIERALAALTRLPQTRLVAHSGCYVTAPQGYVDQPDFINAVALVDTTLAPRALLDALLALELEHGRERSHRDAPRTLDLDLLLYGDAQFVEPGLTIPHPRMHQRAFVLAPLAKLAPTLVIPAAGPVSACLAACADQAVRPLDPPCQPLQRDAA